MSTKYYTALITVWDHANKPDEEIAAILNAAFEEKHPGEALNGGRYVKDYIDAIREIRKRLGP